VAAAASACTSRRGVDAKIAAVVGSVSTSGEGARAETAAVVASVSTSGRGASAKIVERSRARQQKSKREG